MAVLRPPENGDVVYDNKITDAMQPPGNDRYRKADRNGSEILKTSLDTECASLGTVEKYMEILRNIPRTEMKASIIGDGLFVMEDVKAG